MVAFFFFLDCNLLRFLHRSITHVSYVNAMKFNTNKQKIYAVKSSFRSSYLIQSRDVCLIPALLLDSNAPCRCIDHAFVVLFYLSLLLESEFLFDLTLVAIPRIQ